jgi:hypothetical protein
MNRRLLALLAIPAALAIPGHASANSFGADADCDGVTFSMPRGEAGTVVTVTVDGRTVASQTIANQFDPVSITVATPDPSRAHVWVVTVDSLYNPDQRWTETVGVCVTPTTTTSTTLPPASTTTTTVPNPSTTVGTTTPTSQPPTVITTPRPTPSTTLPPFRLPDTGGSTDGLGWLAAFLVGAGVTLLHVRRGGAK